jgi:hypothetical protein
LLANGNFGEVEISEAVHPETENLVRRFIRIVKKMNLRSFQLNQIELEKKSFFSVANISDYETFLLSLCPKNFKENNSSSNIMKIIKMISFKMNSNFELYFNPEKSLK